MTASRYNLLNVLDQLADPVRNAFIASVDDIKRSAQIQVIERHLRDGNIDAALEALNIRREFFEPLERALRDAYRQGGAAALKGLPEIKDAEGARVEARFDMANPRAEDFTRQESAELIVALTQEQRTLAREVMADGLRDQLSVRDIARRLVGYRNKTTGDRIGGVIGLDRQKRDWVLAAEAQLLSGEKKNLRAYLRRKQRNRVFDSDVKDVLEGRTKKLTAEQIRRITSAYSQRLLRLRGNNISRTELIRSLHHAQDEGLRQLVDRGLLRVEQIKRRWDAAEDAATRPTHAAMDGQVRFLGQPFLSPSGAQLMFPGDISLGAPGEEVINCRCVLRIDIDFIAGLDLAA